MEAKYIIYHLHYDPGIDVPDLPAQFFQCGWPGMDEGTCLKRGCCWDDFIKSRNSGSSCYVKPGTCTIFIVTLICLCGVRQLISGDMEVSIVAYEYGWNPP